MSGEAVIEDLSEELIGDLKGDLIEDLKGDLGGLLTKLSKCSKS